METHWLRSLPSLPLKDPIQAVPNDAQMHDRVEIERNLDE
jgi:hypothetical protein